MKRFESKTKPGKKHRPLLKKVRASKPKAVKTAVQRADNARAKYLASLKGYRGTLRETLQVGAIVAKRVEKNETEYAAFVASPVWEKMPIRPMGAIDKVQLTPLAWAIAYVTNLDPRQGRAWKWARAVAYWLGKGVAAKAIAAKLKEVGIEKSTKLAIAEQPIYRRDDSTAKSKAMISGKLDKSAATDEDDWPDDDPDPKVLVVEYASHFHETVKSYKRGMTARLQVTASPPRTPPRFTLSSILDGEED